jgi:hypothetical protein
MPSYQIHPFDEPSVPEIGSFLVRSIDALRNLPEAGSDDGHLSSYQPESQPDYRWLLDEDNPYRQDGIPAGEILRDGHGVIVGMIGYHPTRFRFGDRYPLGLGAHNFYVDPSARMQGFTLFRRYLNNPRADFCFSTTCNVNSGPLWAKCGAAPLPGSDSEYILVFRHGPVLEELARKRRVPRALALALRAAGPMASLVMGPRRTRSPLKPQWCDDWDRLAAIADQTRDPKRLTPERSAAVLRCRYQAMSRNAKSSGAPDGAYSFTTPSGREGWLSVSVSPRGSHNQIQSMNLLDLVFSPGSVELSEILRAVIELAKPRADVLTIRDRSSWGLRSGLLGFRRRELPAAEAFVFTQSRSALPQPAELARIADFPPSFGT